MSEYSLLTIIKDRRSIRKFLQQRVSERDISDIIEAGIHAPSGSNTQCYRFLIITDKKDIDYLGTAKIPIVANAPVIILAVADLRDCKYLQTKRAKVFDKLPYQDVAMAMQNMCLLAEAKGLGSCVIHLSEQWHTAKEIKKYFNLQDYHELMGMILLGYSNELVNYEKGSHAGRPIKRKAIEHYILKRR